MDQDPFQRRIYFLTFVELLDMIFSFYTEICEIIIDDPKIGEDDIKDDAKRSIRNISHANIDLHKED